MSLKISAVLLLAMVCTALAIVCPPNYCDKVDCSNAIEKNDCEQNKNGLFEEHGTFCGCCPACLIKLTEGESCRPLFAGIPPRSRCAPGLTCDVRTGTCLIMK